MHKRHVLAMAAGAAAFACAARAQVDTVLHTPDGPVPIRWQSCDPTGAQVKLSPGTIAHPEGGAPVLVELTDARDAPRDAALEFDFPISTNWQPVRAVQFWVRPEGPLPERGLSVRVYAGGRGAASGRIKDLKPGEWSPVTLTGKFRGTWDFGLDQHRCKIRLGGVAAEEPVTVRFQLDNVRFLTATKETRQERIETLKDLHLDTVLAARGKPRAAIVAPAGARYAAAVRTVQAAIKQHAGLTLPVHSDADVTTRELLEQKNVIVLGNMASNRFIEQLYREYYTLTDLYYPGQGGYEVRTLHDPYGTGHNVIFLGSSDDAGVAEAARVFASVLTPGDPLKVARLMKIKLGPELEALATGKRAHSWSDCWRPGNNGKGYGYGPASVFGWNSMSIAAARYYMTGAKEQLERFVELILPDPDNIPKQYKKFKDPLKPLAGHGHYNMHLLALYWDLIEESPLLSDEQRLRITNALLEHQNKYDPNNTYRGAGGRHSQWHMFTIYTGSRYFAKYYPHPRWETRLNNARKAYGGLVGKPTVGTDSQYWRNTVTQPVVDFCVLDGLDELVTSGTIRDMMSALFVLWQGHEREQSNKCQSINLMREAAYLAKDGRYLWLADKAGYPTNVFRLGQSFTPPPDLRPVPPTELIGRISVFPPRKSDSQGYRFLSYRSGLGPKDDYLLLDGYYGASRTVYHVNALHTLRMGGTQLLRGDENQVRVRRQGMVTPKVAKAAALETAVCSGDGLYVRSTVPDMPFSSWSRHILYLKDLYTIVFDEIRARQTGQFDITCDWRGTGRENLEPKGSRAVRLRGGTTVACGVDAKVSVWKASVSQKWSQQLEAGASCTMGNLIYPTGPVKTQPCTAESVGDRALLIEGGARALACVGGWHEGDLAIDAEAAHLATERIFGANVRSVVCGDTALLTADKPLTLLWDPAEGKVEIDSASATRLALRVAQPSRVEAQTDGVRVKADGELAQIELPPGRHNLSGCHMPDPLTRQLAAALARLEPAARTRTATAAAEELEEAPDWRPAWTAAVEGGLDHLAFSAHTRSGTVWAAGKKGLAVADMDGKLLWQAPLESPARSLWAASSPAQADAFGAVVGCDDEQVHAFRADGTKSWTVETEQAPKPWPYSRDKLGVLALLAGDLSGDGREQIALGRASTVELRGLDGALLKRVRVLWGDNTTLALLPKGRAPEAPFLIAGQFFCGHSDLSLINAHGDAVTHEAYRWDFPRGVQKMTAWTQQGTSHLATRDLDGDGTDEVIVVRSGHWNELDVYDARGNCRWMRYFGPAASLSHFMRALAIVDLDGDGKQEVVVGMDDGWVCAFDADGAPLWQRRFGGGIRGLAGLGKSLAVGDRSGRISLVSAGGRVTRSARLDSGIAALCAATVAAGRGPVLFAATRDGQLARFDAAASNSLVRDGLSDPSDPSDQTDRTDLTDR